MNRGAKILLLPTALAWIAGYLTCLLVSSPRNTAQNAGQHLLYFLIAGTVLVLPSFLFWIVPSTVITFRRLDSGKPAWPFYIDLLVLVIGYAVVATIVLSMKADRSPPQLIFQFTVPFVVFSCVVASLKAWLSRGPSQEEKGLTSR